MVQIINALFALIFDLLGSLLSGIGGLIVQATPTRRMETYNADFAHISEVFGRQGDGYMIGSDFQTTLEVGYRHILVAGNSGSGKSTCICIPSTIAIETASLIINDPGTEIRLQTSGVKEHQGFHVLVLDFAHPEKSNARFNPMARCKNKSDLKKLAKLLVTATLGNGSGQEKFWNTSAENIIYFFSRFTLFHTPKEHRNLSTVLSLIQKFEGSPKEMDQLIISCGDDEIYTEYKGLVRTDIKLMSNILSTAKAALSLWQDDSIAEMTSTDTISFSEIRKRKTVIYLHSSVVDMDYYAPIVSIFFEQFIAEMMLSLPDEKDLSVCCILDECSSMKLPTLQLALSNLRKYRVSLMCIFQAESQIIDIYGVQAARSITTNTNTRIFLPGQTPETCRMLEILLGKFEFTNDDGQLKQKPLMTADEIRLATDTIILVGGKRPVRMRLKPYYEHKRFRELSEIPLCEINPIPSIHQEYFISDGQS